MQRFEFFFFFFEEKFDLFFQIKDREDMNRWIKAIHTCSFQGLQNKIKDLQKEINSLRRAKNESKIFMKSDYFILFFFS